MPLESGAGFLSQKCVTDTEQSRLLLPCHVFYGQHVPHAVDHAPSTTHTQAELELVRRAVQYILQGNLILCIVLSVPAMLCSPVYGGLVACVCGPSALCCAGSTQDVKWESVQVGQVLQVNDDELFPADLMCLYTALPDKASP